VYQVDFFFSEKVVLDNSNPYFQNSIVMA